MMRLSTLVLAIGMALGSQAWAAETQPHADHSAPPSGQAKEANVTGEANQHDKQKTQIRSSIKAVCRSDAAVQP
ncbi:hypothetical protein M8494_11975 [Serratia ureilytica]